MDVFGDNAETYVRSRDYTYIGNGKKFVSERIVVKYVHHKVMSYKRLTRFVHTVPLLSTLYHLPFRQLVNCLLQIGYHLLVKWLCRYGEGMRKQHRMKIDGETEGTDKGRKRDREKHE